MTDGLGEKWGGGIEDTTGKHTSSWFLVWRGALAWVDVMPGLGSNASFSGRTTSHR